MNTSIHAICNGSDRNILHFLLPIGLLFFSSLSFAAPAGNGGNASKVGQWSKVVNWPNIPLHAVLTPKKEVLTFGTDKKGKQGAHLFYDVWDPKKGTGANSHFTLPNTTGTDLFCTAPAIIPATGDILLAGGDQRVKGSVNDGIKDTFIFNSNNRTLKPTTSMAYARWYPTATVLANGEIFLHGGRAGKKQPILVPEIFNPATSKWRSLPGASSSAIISTGGTRWFYPRNFLIPDGRIFGVTGGQMYYLSTKGKGAYTLAGRTPAKTMNFTSTAVMYQPGKILHLGGGTSGKIKAPASNQAIIIDVKGKNPVIRSTGSMKKGRSWGNATVLPTGDVLVTGGSSIANQMKGTVEVAEIWSPKTEKWTSLASAKLARLYHSSALLLPDGRVMIGGGGSPGPLTNTNVEIFSPPYLFNNAGTPAKRLKIINAPAASGNGKIISVKYAIGKGQQKAVRATLIRIGSVTHSFNMEQRFMELNFQQTGPDQLNVSLPASVNIAPPGFYMLFLLDANNVPSEGHMLKINIGGTGNGGNGGNTTATTGGGNETVNGNGGAGLLIADLNVIENTGTAKIVVSLESAQSKTVRVKYATKSGTAIPGQDFRGRSGTLTFNPGETSKTVNVPIINDQVTEADENFRVKLTNPVNATLLDNQAIVSITEKAGGNNTTNNSQLTINNAFKKEGAGSAKIVVKLAPASNKKITVKYRTVNGSAKAGADYVNKAGTLTFNPGQTNKVIYIKILKDTKQENKENFKVVMSNARNAVIGDKTGIVVIKD